MKFACTHKCIVQVHRELKEKMHWDDVKNKKKEEEVEEEKNRARHTKEMEWNGEKRMKSGSWLCECEEPTTKG